MAFRGYELNLMLRVQDRATTRLRRLSADLGGVGRAAQMQRDAARVARNAYTQNAIIEQNAARDRLLGLQGANAQAQILTRNLNAAAAAGRLTAREVAAIEASYNRMLRAERTMRRARMVTHAGSVAALAGGLGLITAGGLSSSFAEFNRQAVAAATQMRGVNESFASTVQISTTLQTSLLELTRQFPATATEMANAIYDIASGMNFQIDRTGRLTETQQRFNQSFALLKRANEVAVAGNLDLATATDVLIRVFNNFDPARKRVIQTLNELFAVVRFGKGTFQEFSPQLGRVASAANAAGQSLIETGSALAFLSQRLPLPQAATALVRIFQIIGRREFTTGFEQLFKVSPFKEGTRQLKSLSELMFIIEKQGPKVWKGFERGSVDLMNVLQNITAAGQDAMRDTTGSVGLQSTEFARRAVTNFIVFGKQYRDTVEEVGGTQGEFIKSLQAFREQPGVQWQIALNQFRAFAIILGQDVIPVMLRFMDFIRGLAHRYEELSPHVRQTIASFATWGSIILFVGGAITSILGGIGILIARLGGLMTILGIGGGAGVVGRMLLLQRVVRGLLAIGTIKIGVELIKKGDQSLWSTILGGAAQIGGAAFIGSRVAGWQGAVIAGAFAAYSLPMQMAAAEMKKQGEVSRETINKEIKRIEDFQAAVERISGPQVARRAALKARTIVIRAVYEQRGLEGIQDAEKFMKGTLTKMQQDVVDYARSTGVSHMFYQGHKAVLDQLAKDNATTTESIADRWKRLATELTGLDVFGGLSAQVAEAAAMAGLRLAKAEASGNKAAIAAALRSAIAIDKQEIKRMERLPKTAERVKNLTEVYNDLTSKQEQLNNLYEKDKTVTEKANLAGKKQSAINEAKREQTEKISRAVDTLIEKYKELEEANKAAFRIFEGPISQGPIVQVFNNINQMLMGLGRRPIPIPIRFQIQDVSTQVANFKRFVEDLSVLRRRGVPTELIQELQAKGPTEGLAIVEGLRQAGQGAINQYVKFWNEGQALIKSTTDKQMSDQLKEWRNMSKGIAWQIVQGLADEKSQATLRKGYTKYITDVFKTVLAKELSETVKTKVDEYLGVQAAKKGAKKTGTATGATATKPEPTRTTQSVTHNHYGDTVTVKADGATPATVKTAFDRHAFDKRNRI